MVAPIVAQAGSAVVTAAPKVINYVKNNLPAVYAKAEKQWKRSGGGDILQAVSSAANGGDVNTVKAMYETLLKNGARRQQLVMNTPNLSEDDLRSFLGKVARISAQNRDLSDSNVASQGESHDVLDAKAAELARVQQILNLSIDEIVAVLVFMNTTTTSQIRRIEQSAIATRNVRVKP